MLSYSHFDNDTLPIAETVARSLRDSMQFLIQKATWMDEHTKRNVVLKLDQLHMAVGYPEWIMNDAELNRKYHQLSVSPTKSFFDNYNALTHFQQMQVREETKLMSLKKCLCK